MFLGHPFICQTEVRVLFGYVIAKMKNQMLRVHRLAGGDAAMHALFTKGAQHVVSCAFGCVTRV